MSRVLQAKFVLIESAVMVGIGWKADLSGLSTKSTSSPAVVLA